MEEHGIYEWEQSADGDQFLLSLIKVHSNHMRENQNPLYGTKICYFSVIWFDVCKFMFQENYVVAHFGNRALKFIGNLYLHRYLK